jgi:hypothetical protein
LDSNLQHKINTIIKPLTYTVTQSNLGWLRGQAINININMSPNDNEQTTTNSSAKQTEPSRALWAAHKQSSEQNLETTLELNFDDVNLQTVTVFTASASTSQKTRSVCCIIRSMPNVLSVSARTSQVAMFLFNWSYQGIICSTIRVWHVS